MDLGLLRWELLAVVPLLVLASPSQPAAVALVGSLLPHVRQRLSPVAVGAGPAGR